MKHIGREVMGNLPIPLPRAEQRRIVANVEQVMAVVDGLETQLAPPAPPPQTFSPPSSPNSPVVVMRAHPLHPELKNCTHEPLCIHKLFSSSALPF